MAEVPADLAVVIGTRNRRARLEQCLDSLIGKIATPHEIIVVDAGSTDGTQQYLGDLGSVTVVQDGQPLGQARSLNRVFRTINARFICWLSDDNVVAEGALDSAVSILEQEADIGLVGLKVKDMTGPRQNEAYIGAIWPSGVLNCNQGVIRAALFRQIGFFDEAYQSYGLDPDLTTQVLLAGYKVVLTRQVALQHYRDHTGSPGAMEAEERAARRQAAHAIYKRKFRTLIIRRPFLQRWLRGGMWRAIIRPAYLLASRLRMPLAKWIGYNERDWHNLLYSRHISLLDFVANRHKPYYLVQRLSAQLRMNQRLNTGELRPWSAS